MKKLFYIFLAAFIFRIVLAFIVWHPDLNNHIDWGIRFWQYGFDKFYSANVWSFTWPNQPPGTIYLFAGIRKLFEFVFSILWTINIKIPVFPSIIVSYAETNLYPALLKLPGILSDLGIGYLIYKLVYKLTNKEKLSIFGLCLWLFNPIVWYNSAVWGQYDSVINFLALLSFYFLIEKKLLFAFLAMAISLYTKASLLIFLPIFAIIAFRQKYPLKKWIISFVVTLLAIGLITLPFAKGEPFSWLFNLFKDKIFAHQLQVITANAFNIWVGVAGIHERPQTLPFLGMTYQYWSYILFSIFYLPTLWLVWKKQNIKSIVWSLAIAAFGSFMLLTNMHERYLYPLFPYLTILTAVKLVSIYPYILISLLSLLNLYNFWWVPQIPFLVDILSWGDRLVPRILGGINFLLYLNIYSKFYRYIKKN